jgi:predicted RNase H-like HicB family nuclease
MSKQFTSIIKQDGEWFVGSCPEIPGANGQGRTVEECRASLSQAIALILKDALEDSLALNQTASSINLWAEEPKAKLFCQSVVDDIRNYKIYPNEEFCDFQFAILSTSAIDLQGEAFTPEALESGARKMNEETLWIGALHDPLIQPFGRVIRAKVFYAPKTDIFFIAAVIGMYDPNVLPRFRDLGIEVPTLAINHPELSEGFQNKAEHAQLAFSPHEIDRTIIYDLLANAPDIVSKQALRSLRKSADPITILSVIVSIGLLIYNPFSKKFLERLGERAADGSIAFFAWLSNKVFVAIGELKRKRVLFEFVSDYKDCRIQFVVNTNDTAVLCEASNSIFTGAQSAVGLIDRTEHLQIQRLIYEFEY